MNKAVAFLRAWFLKEEGKISMTKLLATVASLCGIVVALQSQLISAGFTIPVQYIPYFKLAGVVSALIAMVKIRNHITDLSGTPVAPTSPVVPPTGEPAGSGTPVEPNQIP
jgi:hypothetical protein